MNTPILPPISLRIPYNWKYAMDIQKTMDFILEQNAATVAQREGARRHREEDLQIHTEWKIEMSQALQDLAGQMKDGFRDVAKAQRELIEAHQATEESLNILIQTVQDILPRLPKQ